MAKVTVYDQGKNQNFWVNFDLKYGIINDGSLPQQLGYYIEVSTNMRYPDGTAMEMYAINQEADVPPAYPGWSDLTEMVEFFVEYYMDQSENIASSSSSSSESSASSASSISSSSVSSVSSASSHSSSSSSSIT